MMKEDTAQLRICVPIEDLWKAMSSELRHITPKILPNLVEEIELLEGNGGFGSILRFKFFPHVPKVSFQKEKITEYDESMHQICFELLEGGHLDHGYSSYTTGCRLTTVGESETMIDVKVVYETKPDHTHMPGETMKSTFHYIKCLENYLLKGQF